MCLCVSSVHIPILARLSIVCLCVRLCVCKSDERCKARTSNKHRATARKQQEAGEKRSARTMVSVCSRCRRQSAQVYACARGIRFNQVAAAVAERRSSALPLRAVHSMKQRPKRQAKSAPLLQAVRHAAPKNSLARSGKCTTLVHTVRSSRHDAAHEIFVHKVARYCLHVFHGAHQTGAAFTRIYTWLRI